MRKWQVVVSLSIVEVDYMEATHVCEKAIWLMKLCSCIRLSQRAITIQCDNNNVICLAKNPTFQEKTKHIDVQYHLVQHMVEDEKVILEKVDTLQNVANALTKPMNIGKFKLCCESMGLVALSN